MLDHVLATVEVDIKHLEVLKFRIGLKLRQDRLLRCAGGAPRSGDVDQNRLAGLLGRLECGGV